MTVNGVPLYGQFVPNVLVDGRPRPAKIQYINEGNIAIITTQTPVFLSELGLSVGFVGLCSCVL